MAETVDPVVTPAAPAAAASPAPVAAPAPSPETIVPAQPAAATPDPAAIATPEPGAQDAPAAPGEAPKAETPKVEEGFKPTILDELDKPKDEAKADEKPAADTDPKAPATDAEPAPAPTLDPIDYFAAEGGVKLPDTLKMDDTQRGELATALDVFRADPTKGAQQIIDMGVKVITDAVEQHRRDQWTVWNSTQSEWQNQVKADPILGGAGHDTAMIAVGQGRNRLASTHKPGTEEFAKDLADFNEMARITGVGNHPVFLRMLHRAGKLFAEAAPPPPDPRPAPDNGRRPSGKRDLYTNTKFPGQA